MLNIGSIFGRLTVVRVLKYQQILKRKSTKIRYMCLCSCGKKVIAEGYRLRSGHKRSCGCLQRDAATKSGKNRRKHGYAGDDRPPEYMTWVRMRRRCQNSESDDYSNYGGRGISVCDRWEIFSNFLEDMGKRPSKHHSIDRINNNGNYTPDNCRWATIKQQNRNKRTTRELTIERKTLGLGEWAEISGINLETIRSRLNRGWSSETAVFGPLKQVMLKTGNRWKGSNYAVAATK